MGDNISFRIVFTCKNFCDVNSCINQPLDINQVPALYSDRVLLHSG